MWLHFRPNTTRQRTSRGPSMKNAVRAPVRRPAHHTVVLFPSGDRHGGPPAEQNGGRVMRDRTDSVPHPRTIVERTAR
jgi:hypothetical protein